MTVLDDAKQAVPTGDEAPCDITPATWRFQDGRLREYSVPWVEALTALPEDESGLGAAGGYEECFFFGGMDSPGRNNICLTIHCATGKNREDWYLGVLDLGGYWELIFLPDFPDMVEFVRLVEPLLLLSIRQPETAAHRMACLLRRPSEVEEQSGV